jgi:beta-barrel assembly-enhancing protease
VLGGGSGAGQQLIMLGTNLADMNHSRGVETRADARGAQLLEAGGYSTLGLVSFFTALAEQEADLGAVGDWMEMVSSHPDTQRRIEAAEALGQPGRPALSDDEWRDVQVACR